MQSKKPAAALSGNVGPAEDVKVEGAPTRMWCSTGTRLGWGLIHKHD